MKAEFVGKAWNEKDGYNSPVYEYKYRGRTYYVVDYKNGYSETMRTQHINEQARIDRIIEAENQQSEPIDWDKIFDMLEWN